MPATLDRPPTEKSTSASRADTPAQNGSAFVPKKRYTVSDWAAFEETQTRKHELRNGEFFEMAGATYEHNRVSANLLIEVGKMLPDHCEVMGSDQRVYIENTNGLYPDIVVVCGEPEIGIASALYNPLLIVEVLSPSTSGDDRGEKFEKYRTLPTLIHYVLVEQSRPSVEHFQKGENGLWVLAAEHHALNETLSLVIGGVSVSLPLAAIYRRIPFAAPEAAENSQA